MDKQTPPHPTFHQPTREERVDAAMLADKQADGYWQRAVASAMAAQLQQNWRDSNENSKHQ